MKTLQVVGGGWGVGAISTSQGCYEHILLWAPEPQALLPATLIKTVTYLATGMAVMAPQGERKVTATVHAHHDMCDGHQGWGPLP
jgi:hypothetical protein